MKDKTSEHFVGGGELVGSQLGHHICLLLKSVCENSDEPVSIKWFRLISWKPYQSKAVQVFIWLAAYSRDCPAKDI